MNAARAWRHRRSHWPRLVVAVLWLLLGEARGATLMGQPVTLTSHDIAPAFFGTHFHRLGAATATDPATEWPDGLVGGLRLWDSTTRWADLEPRRGQFDFARLDGNVETALAHGADALLVLGSPPRWASARPDELGPYGPGCAAEPRDFADWDRYVAAVVQRYKGRIARYELWNEPYFSDVPADRGQSGAFFSGSAATMVELARRTRAVIDRFDPAARLLAPGFVGAPDRLALFLHAGGGAFVDGIAYHFYVEDDAAFVRLHGQVRDVMARAGLARLPLLNTESGIALRGVEGQPIARGEGVIDRRTAAATLARSMILAAALGIDRFYQYAWDNGRMGMVLPGGRVPTPSRRAYASVRAWLVGTTLDGCHDVPGGVRCEGHRGDRRLLLGWRTDGVRATLAWPEGWRPLAIEHATDGPLPVPVTHDLALPVDGMPVAVWANAR